MSEHDLIDESVLRRALRFEADEHPPRFDAATLVATAARERGQFGANRMVALVAAVTLTYATWAAIAAVAPTFLVTLLDAALALVASVAVPALLVVETAQEPVVPTSLVAALVIAIVYEMRQRKEQRRVVAS
jgi:hypothetical protein